jgi:polar amino acid transport system substrate-binding protein
MKNRLQINITLAFFFIISLSANLYAHTALQQQNIVIATIDYPPLLGKKGTIMTDIANAAFQAKGINVQYKTYPLARVIKAINANSITAALGSRHWFYKENAAASKLFVSIYWLNMHFFYLKSNFPQGLVYQNLSDLQDYKIGYIRGGVLTQTFENTDIKPNLVATLRQTSHKTYAGRDDMFAATKLGGWAIINKYHPDKIDLFSASEKPIKQLSADIIFTGQQQGLYETFKEGFDIIKKNGTYLKIIDKYYDERTIPDGILKLLE